MEEICYYKAGVAGSIPATATELVRNSIGLEYRSFTPGVVSSNLTGPTNCLNGDFERLKRLKRLTGLERQNPFNLLIHPNLPDGRQVIVQTKNG